MEHTNSPNLRILVIDDNPEIHNDFIKILTKESENKSLEDMGKELFGESPKKFSLPNFVIHTASQGKEGFDRIVEAKKAGNPYALAFVDIRMPPGWDGIETIKHIWEVDNDIQIVICTAYSDYSWEKTVDQLGMRENLLILKKPFDHIAVRQLAMALTKKWELSQETQKHTKFLEENIKERTKSLEESLDKIKFQATHDILTKLPNREMINNFIHQRLMKSSKKFAVLFFDLDRFKLINDSFSHATGDELLKSVASRIKENMREQDFIGRLGGDEFVMILSSFKSLNAVRKFANKLLDIFKFPFKIFDLDLIISPSIGISIFPDDGKTVEELLRNADMGMYHAKDLGGAQFQFYTEDLSQESMKKLEMEMDLHRAITNEEFFLCYQPQYDLSEKKIVSVEALIRWNHPQKGIILPIDFIPLAEEIGLVSTITEWVIKTSCTQNKKWQTMGLAPIRVAINISTNEFKQPYFLNLIKNILDETQLKPQYLELELTENIIINSIDAVNKIIQLKELGVSIAIDDFGTGYSSLNYLRKIPFDRLKIDQSFVKNIDINRGDEIIIQAIISMAKNLNLEILAEGVETKKQLDFLKSKQCNEVQGFYYSKPLQAEGLEELLKNPEKIVKIC